VRAISPLFLLLPKTQPFGVPLFCEGKLTKHFLHDIRQKMTDFLQWMTVIQKRL